MCKHAFMHMRACASTDKPARELLSNTCVQGVYRHHFLAETTLLIAVGGQDTCHKASSQATAQPQQRQRRTSCDWEARS